MAELNASFGDREILLDMMASQKSMSGHYEECACDCVSAALQGQFLTLLGEEQQMRMELMTELQKRGWYEVQNATPEAIKQIYEHFCGGDS